MKLALALALLLPAGAGAQEACQDYPMGVVFCPGAAGLAGEPPGDDGRAVYYGDDYGAVIEVAPLSATSYADPADMRPILNDYIAERRGFDDGLPVIATDRIDLGDRAAEQVIYRLEARDTLVADTLALGDGFGLFVQTYAEDEEFTEAHRLFHDAVLSAITLPAPEISDLGLRAGRPEARPLAVTETDR